jgi:hypothetical protein
MISINLVGGLGNQLFQIFATIAISIEYNIPFHFLNILNTPGITNRTTYWQTLFKNIHNKLISNYPNNMIDIKEQDFTFHPLPNLTNIINNNFNIKLHGYFQSYKYFEKYNNEISNLLQINNLKKDLLDRYSTKINKNYENTISIHFRFGDYKKLTHIYNILNINYYRNALNYILNNNNNNNKLNILYFCQETDIDDTLLIINELKKEFKELTFECISFFIKDWEQLLIMSECKYNIIANSTFSWWAAYLNNYHDKIVCSPDKWFVKEDMNTKDLLPFNWSLINFS